MDLTTLFAAITLVFGLLTFDTIRTSDAVFVEVADVPAIEKTNIDQDTLEAEFARELNEVGEIVSIIVPPEIRTQRDIGVTRALGAMLKINDLAYAIETDLGYRSDRMRLALFTDKGRLGALVTGRGKTIGPFRALLYPRDGESLLDFVRRCSATGAFHLAPYGTTLHLMQVGAGTGNMAPAKMASERAKSMLPNTMENFDRSLLENVDGLIALFGGDVAGAHDTFLRAVASSSRNWVASLNAAFTEIQIHAFDRAESRMRALIPHVPADRRILRSTAYMTQAAALLGLNRPEEADALLVQALTINPDNSGAWFYRAATRAELGDLAGAEQMRRRAFQTNDSVENFAEVATLYFLLNWTAGDQLIQSPFPNPVVTKRR